MSEGQRARWKLGEHGPSEINMGQISEGLVVSIKDFDL